MGVGTGAGIGAGITCGFGRIGIGIFRIEFDQVPLA